jgi:hypothetical protein
MGMIMMNKNAETETETKHILTNKVFINTMLEPEDVTKIMRVFNWWLEKRCDRYAPIWIKEALYEEWLNEEFDNKSWASAGIQRSEPGSIPKDYCRSVRRFCNPMFDAKKKMTATRSKATAPGTSETGEGVFKSEMNANYKPVPTKI